MREHWFTLELEDDVVVSARAATVGAHRCLDYLPGSAFLGAAAASFYRRWKTENNGRERWPFEAFHAGRMRFCNAYPLENEGHPAVPIPASWHHSKGDEPTGESLTNCAIEPWDHAERGQEQQARSGWLSTGGAGFTLPRQYRMKTAIGGYRDDSAGNRSDVRHFDRAAERALFGFGALPAGLRLRASVQAEDDLEDALWEKLVGYFSARRELRIGRSRNAEFGRITIVAAHASPDSADLLKIAVGNHDLDPAEKTVYLYALSDVALRDEAGQPSLSLGETHLEQLGIHGAKPNLGRTFIRARAYSPFNQYRNVHDLERQVIGKGSVLALDLADGTPTPAPGVRWLGSHQQDGLGCILVNPPWLRTARPSLKKGAPMVGGTDVSAGGIGSEPFAIAMQRRFEQKQIHLLAIDLGREWATGWERDSPGPSQWARIREAALQSRTLGELIERLTEKDEGIFERGLSAGKWGSKHDPRSLRERVLKALRNNGVTAARLKEVGLNADDQTLRDRLALAACYEAAVAVARMKQG